MLCDKEMSNIWQTVSAYVPRTFLTYWVSVQSQVKRNIEWIVFLLIHQRDE